MIIKLINNDFRFDISNIILLFFPRINTNDETDGIILTVTLTDFYAEAILSDDQTIYSHKIKLDDSLFEFQRYACDRSVFEVCLKNTGKQPPWGLLIGVRPVNFYLKIKNLYGDKCEEILENLYLVLPDKIKLCSNIIKMRQESVDRLTNNSFSLYVSIPFCPSRCRYCSFVSYSTEKETIYLEKYVDILCDEIKNNAKHLCGQSPLTVYIGGGTPTCLPDHLFEKVLNCITTSFDLSDCFEFTVESGRPETITDKKLQIMRNYDVSRICVNPQSLSDDVLRAAKRNHSVSDFFNAYSLSENYQFDINVDLIAGLPYESIDSFLKGLSKVIELSPANITIHSLYIKRAADYGSDASLYSETNPECVTEMLNKAYTLLEKSDYHPYYLYRQKNTVGNNENIGSFFT